MAQKICLKSVLKDLAKSWAQNEKAIPSGIIAYEEDTNKMKIGDGMHKFAELPYAGGECAGQDALEKEVEALKEEIKSLKSSIPVEPISLFILKTT